MRYITLIVFLTHLSLAFAAEDDAKTVNNSAEKLQNTIGRVLNVDEALKIGSPGFDAVLLKRLVALGSRDQMVLALIERSAASGIGVEIFSYQAFLNFQWIGEQSAEANCDGVIFYASFQVQLDKLNRPIRVKSSFRSEPSQNLPAVNAKGPINSGMIRGHR